MVTEDSIAEAIVCGPDPKPYAEAIDEYLDAEYHARLPAPSRC